MPLLIKAEREQVVELLQRVTLRDTNAGMRCTKHKNRPIYKRPFPCKECWQDAQDLLEALRRANHYLVRWKQDATRLLANAEQVRGA